MEIDGSYITKNACYDDFRNKTPMNFTGGITNEKENVYVSSSSGSYNFHWSGS